MADKKISAMTDGGAIDDTDQIPIVRGGANRRAQVGTMAAEDAADYTKTADLGGAAFSEDSDFATAAQGATADTALQPAAVGVSVQGYDADTAAIAALSGTSGFLAKTAAGTWALRVLQAALGFSWTNPAGVAGDPIQTFSGVKTLYIPAGAMVPSVVTGCAEYTRKASASNQPDIGYLAFDQSTEEYAQFSVKMPKSWDEGTVTAQFVWSHPAATSFGAVWGIQGVSIADNEAMATSYGTAQTVTDTGGTTSKQYISAATSAITIASAAEGEMQYFRVYRKSADASDTLDSDAQLQGVILFYTTNTLTDA